MPHQKDLAFNKEKQIKNLLKLNKEVKNTLELTDLTEFETEEEQCLLPFKTTDPCLIKSPSSLFSTPSTSYASSSLASIHQTDKSIPLVDKSDTSENYNRKIILLAGPGYQAFDKHFVQRIHKALKTENTVVVQIGDGESGLTEKEMAIFFDEISNADEKVTLFLQCHGEMVFGNHVIFLNNNPMKLEDFLLVLSKKLSENPIDIFSTACYGSIAAYLCAQLPKGSTYVALNNEPVNGNTIKNFITHLEENFHSKIDRTSQALLMLYLSNALNAPSNPIFISSRNDEHCCQTVDTLNSHLGRKFSQSEISLIKENLYFLVSNDRVEQAIKEIENSKYIPADNFGLALAICHVASGSIQQPLDHEINSFQPLKDEKRKCKI